jgi:hypothetical protein
VDTGATARRTSHSIAVPMAAIGVGSSSARAWPVCRALAITEALTTPIKVSDARAYTAEGMTQMARSRQPRVDTSAFMARLIPTHARLSVLARIARLPCRASAMPKVAKMTAPMSGMPASRLATAGLCFTDRTSTYWASQDTTAAAAASTASASIAPRSQPAARSAVPARSAAKPFPAGRLA